MPNTIQSWCSSKALQGSRSQCLAPECRVAGPAAPRCFVGAARGRRPDAVTCGHHRGRQGREGGLREPPGQECTGRTPRPGNRRMAGGESTVSIARRPRLREARDLGGGLVTRRRAMDCAVRGRWMPTLCALRCPRPMALGVPRRRVEATLMDFRNQGTGGKCKRGNNPSGRFRTTNACLATRLREGYGRASGGLLCV